VVLENCAAAGYVPQSYVPKVKTGHVVPGITLDRVKKQLAEVKGALVECPLVCSSPLFCWLY
jgi:predicted transcriptional regulator